MRGSKIHPAVYNQVLYQRAREGKHKDYAENQIDYVAHCAVVSRKDAQMAQGKEEYEQQVVNEEG